MYASTVSSVLTPARAFTSSALHAVASGPSTRSESDPLDRCGTIVRIEKNRSLYYEGDEARHCFRVRAGTVRLCKITEDGRRQIAAFLTAGELFGWADRDAYGFSAEAVTDVVVEKFDRRRMEQAAAADPKLARHILTLLSDRLASAQSHLVLLGRLTAAERIATFLVDLVKRQKPTPANSGTVELTMTRRDLADYLGLTVETVSRVMNGMKRRRIISFTAPENVELTQSAALERLAMAA